MTKVRFIGLDVHADTMAVAVAEPSGEVRSPGIRTGYRIGIIGAWRPRPMAVHAN